MRLATATEQKREIQLTRISVEILKSLSPTPTAKLAAQIDSAERRLNELIAESANAPNKLADEIRRRVKGAASDVLIQRYVYGKSFGAIAQSMHYSTANIYYLHRRGKREFEKEQPA